MARTLYGNLTGNAAVLERMDYMEFIQDSAREERRRWQDAYHQKLNELKQADDRWEVWYDNDKNIPEYIRWNEDSVKPLIAAMDARMMHVQIRDEQPHLLSAQN